MVNLNDIKNKAKELKERATDENLGPDRGTMDQEQARIERARQEARQEAERKRVQQRVDEARENARENVLTEEQSITSRVTDALQSAANAVDDGDDEVLDDLGTAFQTDFDGDGEPFSAELGLQGNQRAQAENQAIESLEQEVSANRGDIDELFGFGDSADQGSEEIGVFDAPSLEEMGFDDDGGGF